MIELISAISNPRYEATKRFLEKSEQALIGTEPDYIAAIRAVFDAAENVYKLMFPNLPRISAQNINSNLKTRIGDLYPVPGAQQKATTNILESFRHWTEAAHNYRHAEGAEVIVEPDEQTAIALISQGHTFVRWLVKLDSVNLD